VYIGKLNAGDSVTQKIDPARHAWVQVGEGEIELNGQVLSKGDGAAVSEETRLQIESRAPSQILLFDLN
jgi:redox-sensitive bicupin YhaK (pirin superfamily)